MWTGLDDGTAHRESSWQGGSLPRHVLSVQRYCQMKRGWKHVDLVAEIVLTAETMLLSTFCCFSFSVFHVCIVFDIKTVFRKMCNHNSSFADSKTQTVLSSVVKDVRIHLSFLKIYLSICLSVYLCVCVGILDWYIYINISHHYTNITLSTNKTKMGT